MSITQIFTAEAEAAATRYGLLVEGWRALYQRALNESDFGSRRQADRISQQAYAIARTYLDAEDGHIEQSLDKIATEAHRVTLAELSSQSADDISDDALELLSALQRYLRHEIAVQVERDIAFLMDSLNRTYLQVSLAAKAHGTGLKAALIQYQIGNATELVFFFHDRQTRKWPSRKFVRAIWRHSLLTAYNEIVLITLAEHGEARAVIHHVDPKSHSHGIIIAMGSGSEFPTYSEIRNEIFHPNSDAIVAREVR